MAPPAPPPPPGGLRSGRQATAGPKLKPLVWQKVPKNRLKGTVWQDIKDSEGEGASEAEPSFDAAKFEAVVRGNPSFAALADPANAVECRPADDGGGGGGARGGAIEVRVHTAALGELVFAFDVSSSGTAGGGYATEGVRIVC